MKGRDKNIKNCGSITVFLSLILLLILSLLFTIIEGARISTAKIYANRALTTAMDSVLAEFYGPLWEEYHIFGLDTENSCNTVWNEDVSAQMQNYMSYTFTPIKDLNHSYMERMELYDISVESLSACEGTMVTDFQGELFINEAVEYMKYKELGDDVEQLLEKMSLLESPKKVSVLYEEKQKVEEELVEIDVGVLELMKFLDGVKTGKRGIELEKDGSLKTMSYFVKKICFGTATKDEVGISQEYIFLPLKDSYINPMLDFTAIEDNFLCLEEIIKNISIIDTDYNNTVEAISEANITLAELGSMDSKTKEVKAQIKKVKVLIKDLEDQRVELLKERDTYESRKLTYINNINSNNYNLSLLMNGITPQIESAITAIDKILDKTGKAGVLINGYEESLFHAQDEIGEEIFDGMEEDLNELKRYTQTNRLGYDFAGMKQTLEYDLSVLSQVESLIAQGGQELSLKNFQNAKVNFRDAGQFLRTYQTNNLTLDYSTIVLNKNDKLNPMEMAGSFLQEGVTGLVIDSDTISDSQLTKELLPSIIAAMAAEEDGFLNKITSFFENSVVSDKNSGMGDMFGSFREDVGTLAVVGEGINTMAERLLFQKYIGEHFYSFPNEGEDIAPKKPSVLSYEQEYLLVGKTTDKENLSSVISRIICLRTILDFVSILGDKDKCNEAELAASALVGFTGLPILVSITKTLILLVWSFAEALLDTCAMLMGKEIPILKKNVIITFPELFLLNYSFIQKKASEIIKAKEASLTYHDYLYIFLLIKSQKELAYRSMDLIQENIRIRYADDFSIQNCLFGFKAEASFLMDSKFTGIKLIQKQIGSSPKGFKFCVNAAYSY